MTEAAVRVWASTSNLNDLFGSGRRLSENSLSKEFIALASRCCYLEEEKPRDSRWKLSQGHGAAMGGGGPHPPPHEDCSKVIVKSNGAINACLHIINSRTSRMSSLSRPEDVSDGPPPPTRRQ